MKLRKDQSGFGAIEVLLIIVVLGLIGFATWFFVNKRNDSKTASNTEQTATTDSTSTQPTDTSYFDIPELGVKLLLPQKIDGLYYAGLNNNTKAGLSTYALANISEACDASQSALAYVGYFTDPNAPDPYSGNSTMKQEFPDATNIGGKYYYVATSNGQCTNDPAADFSALKVLREATVVKL